MFFIFLFNRFMRVEKLYDAQECSLEWVTYSAYTGSGTACVRTMPYSKSIKKEEINNNIIRINIYWNA